MITAEEFVECLQAIIVLANCESESWMILQEKLAEIRDTAAAAVTLAGHTPADDEDDDNDDEDDDDDETYQEGVLRSR